MTNLSFIFPTPDHFLTTQTWFSQIQVCSLDLESNNMMKREVKDFLYKMAGLGTEYRIWSLQIRDQLCLEVNWLFLFLSRSLGKSKVCRQLLSKTGMAYTFHFVTERFTFRHAVCSFLALTKHTSSMCHVFRSG